METKLETSATAVIKYRNHRSPWSPRPTPSINPVLSIVHDCWEPEKARNAMRRINAQLSVPHKLVKSRSRMKSSVEDRPEAMRARPIVPRREASLGKYVTVRPAEPLHGGWSQLRRTSAANWRTTRAIQEERRPSTATCPDEFTTGAETGNEPSPNHLGMLRSPRSMGPGILRGQGFSASGTNSDGLAVERRGMNGGSLREQGQRSSNRWSWTGWFS